jgi:hypothetical protein
MKSTLVTLMSMLAVAVVFATPMEAKAAPKDFVHLSFPYSNDECRTFSVVSEADRPLMVTIEVCDQRANAPNWYEKVRVDPGEAVCVNDDRYLHSAKYCMVYIVGAWYSQ